MPAAETPRVLLRTDRSLVELTDPLAGIHVMGGVLVGASEDRASPDGAIGGRNLHLRRFRVSDRLCSRFEGLEPPLYDRQGPSEGVFNLFIDCGSYLAFLGISPEVGEGWRFSLCLATELTHPAHRQCLPRFGTGGRAVLVNFGPERADVPVQVDIEAEGIPSAAMSILVSIPYRSGVCFDTRGWKGHWRIAEGSPHEIVALLAGCTGVAPH